MPVSHNSNRDLTAIVEIARLLKPVSQVRILPGTLLPGTLPGALVRGTGQRWYLNALIIGIHRLFIVNGAVQEVGHRGVDATDIPRCDARTSRVSARQAFVYLS